MNSRARKGGIPCQPRTSSSPALQEGGSRFIWAAIRAAQVNRRAGVGAGPQEEPPRSPQHWKGKWASRATGGPGGWARRDSVPCSR